MALPTKRTIALLEQDLADALRLREDLFQAGDRLVSDFRAKYPKAPAHLVRYADRTLNDYRWRLSGSREWRDLSLPKNKAAIELTGEVGQRILDSLSPSARLDWLYFEARRQQLNHDSAMTKYRVMRLRQLIERQEALRQLAKQNNHVIRSTG